jgi:hypothetical protein
MILYTNGCSHTIGGCFDQRYSWPSLIMKSIVNLEEYSTNPKNIDLKKNSKVLYNEALHGAGNDFIFHKSLETLSSLIETGNTPDYVVIQWSGPNRRLHTLPDKYLFVNPYDNSELGVKFEPFGSEHTLHYMFSLQQFLKENKINYLFFNYMALDISIKKTSIYKEIDIDRFLNFGMGTDILFNGLIDFLKSKNMCCDDAGHPNDTGNYLIAKEITNKLNINLLDMESIHNSIKTLC